MSSKMYKSVPREQASLQRHHLSLSVLQAANVAPPLTMIRAEATIAYARVLATVQSFGDPPGLQRNGSNNFVSLKQA